MEVSRPLQLSKRLEQPFLRSYTPREERIIAGFEDILRFKEEHGRAPCHGEHRDIFERLYAVRLDRLRALDECRTLLAKFDTQGLLDESASDVGANRDQLDDEALLAELGASEPADDDITQLRHVQSREDQASQRKCTCRGTCRHVRASLPVDENGFGTFGIS